MSKKRWYAIAAWWDRRVVGFFHKRRCIGGHKWSCNVLMWLISRAAPR